MALVHSKPFVTIPQHVLGRLDDRFSLMTSRATLIVCPSHLALQWRDEALRCIPKVKVHVCTTMAEYLKLSWNDFLFADLIITSVHFLQNQNYNDHTKKLLEAAGLESQYDPKLDRLAYQLQLKGLDHFGGIKGEVLLSRILFYRIVSDEFHELGAAKGTSTARATRVFLKQLNAQFYIGVTGTPQYGTCEDVLTMARFLDTELLQGSDLAALHSKNHYEKPKTERYAAACCVFMANMVRRNEPQLKLPPLIQSCIYVDMTPQEQGVYHTLHGKDRLMACNHHQLAQEVLNMVGDGKEMTIEEVSAAIQDSRMKRITTLERHLATLEKSIEKADKELKQLELLYSSGVKVKVINDEEVSVRVLIEGRLKYLSECQTRFNVMTNELKDTQRQFNFFQAVLDSLRHDQSQDCSICLEDIVEGSQFVITKCGHIYCTDCMEKLLDTTKQCPMCREGIKVADVMPMKKQTVPASSEKQDDKMAKDDDKEKEMDCSKYGSKLAAFITFMRKTLKEQPDAKFILFVQFRRLMDLVGGALKGFNIPVVRCDGNIMIRNRAIDMFKHSEEVRLILLSSEDSVSGLHLIEATHVVVFHPFMQSTHQLAMAYEKQGIARAWRGGQTHPVNLVRFIVRNSIEEEMARARNYREGVITELDEAPGAQV